MSTAPDIDRIEAFLEVLLDNLVFMEDKMEKAMRDQFLVVGDFDPSLQEAHLLEWPVETLGTPGSHIGFDYYKAMRLKSSTSSAYIRKRYEEASRDMTGNGVIDFLSLVYIAKKEALLIKNFISDRGRFIGSESEQQILTNLETWVQTAIVQTKRLYKEFETGKQQRKGFTSESDDSATTSQEARRSQAVFKVSLNGYNNVITDTLDTLRHSFSDHSETFYKKFLGRALDTSQRRLGGASQFPTEDVEEISRALDDNVRVLAEDQQRRARLFRQKFDLVLDQVSLRNEARLMIWELSEEGKSLPVSGPGVMISGEEASPEELDYWRTLESQSDLDEQYWSAAAETPDDFKLLGMHADLPDLIDGDQHSQYLLKDGGTITGNIEVAEGVKIDGVDLDEHRHTGTDGSKQVHGDDIIAGTIDDDYVDIEDIPPKPINLTTPRMDLEIVPPGVSVIDTHLSFDSFDRYTHELEVRLVPVGVFSGGPSGVYIGGYEWYWVVMEPDWDYDFRPSLYYIPPGASETVSVPLPTEAHPFDNVESGAVVSANGEEAIVIMGLTTEEYPKGVLFRSTTVPPESADDWVPVEVSIPGDTFEPWYENPLAADGKVILGIVDATSGIYEIRSTDAGFTWSVAEATTHTKVSSSGSTFESTVSRLAFSHGRFYRWSRAFTYGDFRIDYSEDQGQSWTAISTGLSSLALLDIVYLGGKRWVVYGSDRIYETIDDFLTVSILAHPIDWGENQAIGPQDIRIGNEDQVVRAFSPASGIYMTSTENDDALIYHDITVPGEIELQHTVSRSEMFELPETSPYGTPALADWAGTPIYPAFKATSPDHVSNESIYAHDGVALVFDSELNTYRIVPVGDFLYSWTSGGFDYYEPAFYGYASFSHTPEEDTLQPLTPEPYVPQDPKVYLFFREAGTSSYHGHNRMLIIDPDDPTSYQRGYSIPSGNGAIPENIYRHAVVTYVNGIPTLFVTTNTGYLWRTTNMHPSVASDWLPPVRVLGSLGGSITMYEIAAHEEKIRIIFNQFISPTHFRKMASSDDGGETWTVSTVPNLMDSIRQNNGFWWRWRSAEGSSVTREYSVSTDGTNWEEKTVPYLNQIGSMAWMSNGQVGIAVNQTAIIVTETGGEDWALYYNGNLSGGIVPLSSTIGLWGSVAWVDKNDNLFVQNRKSKDVYRYNAGAGSFTKVATVPTSASISTSDDIDFPALMGNNYTLHAYNYASASDARYHYVPDNDDNAYALGFSDVNEVILTGASYQPIASQPTPEKQWIMPTSKGWTGSFTQVPGQVNPYFNPQTMFTVNTAGKGVKAGDLMILQTAANEYAGFTYPAEWVNLPPEWEVAYNVSASPYCGLGLYKIADAADEAGTSYNIQLQTTQDNFAHQGYAQGGGWTVSIIPPYQDFSFGTPESYWRYSDNLSPGNLTQTAPASGDKTLVISARLSTFNVFAQERAWLIFEDPNTTEVWRRTPSTTDQFSVISGHCSPGDTVEIGITQMIKDSSSAFAPNAYHMQFLAFVPITLQ